MGDLKLVERPQNYTLGPGAQQAIRHARSILLLMEAIMSACPSPQQLTNASRSKCNRRLDKRLSGTLQTNYDGIAASLVRHSHASVYACLCCWEC